MFDKIGLYDMSRSLLQAFAQEFGSVNCRELTGYDLTSPEGLEALQSGELAERCLRFVEFCAGEMAARLT